MEAKVIDLVSEALNTTAENWTRETALLGALPEFDSMAVVTLLAAMEETFDVEFSDDEITAEAFETIGSLTEFLQTKL
ncbi:acyl carrier protein [Motiliproteus sp. SC1-56]|uniref:acyl carrier protein n=1 Tax=Motiliproteus sp. SC1-56 TaxID=2799565 RepID=UPI001A8DE132|nr:phosphopantetheine-binding protein [Motiliproteus sp. SC1-56]